MAAGDPIENMGSRRIFAVRGLPDARIGRAGNGDYGVKMLGLDMFDPANADSGRRDGDDVPAWSLDAGHDGPGFRVRQAFLRRTSAREGLERSPRGEFGASARRRLPGTAGAPFGAGEHGQIAVKVVDGRVDELMAVKSLSEAEA